MPAADFDMLATFKSSMTIIAWFLLIVTDLGEGNRGGYGDMRVQPLILAFVLPVAAELYLLLNWRWSLASLV